MRKRTIPKKIKPYKVPPLTSETALKKKRKEINATNRQRSKTMENRVAKILRGRRIPNSGANAAYKGDVEVELVNNPGKYIAECKLSAQRTKYDEPILSLRFDWFPKFHMEARNMNAKFGIMVIHYEYFANDYVFVRRDILDMLISKYATQYAIELLAIANSAPLLDLRFRQNGEPRLAVPLVRSTLEDAMTSFNGLSGCNAILPDGIYTILYLDTFARVMQGI